METLDSLIESLAESVRGCLEEAGWNSGRVVDISGYETVLQDDGYELHPAARRWLSSLGRIRLPIGSRGKDWHFDLELAAGSIYPERVKVYESHIGKSLCLIGGAMTDHMSLMMAPDGSVYSGLDDLIWQVGEDELGALECLCGERDFTPLPSLSDL